MGRLMPIARLKLIGGSGITLQYGGFPSAPEWFFFMTRWRSREGLRQTCDNDAMFIHDVYRDKE